MLEDNLSTIDFHQERVARIEEAMLQLLEDWQRKPLVEAMMAFKGFKLVAAMVMVSEVGTFSRFSHPKKLMAFLGLVPAENSSGTRYDEVEFDAPRRSHSFGACRSAPAYLAPLGCKCGNPHARWILVEQATHYRVPPKVSAQLSRRQQGAERWVKELSWSTQTRLSHRFNMLRNRKLHHNKIKVSVARELCAFLWELGTRIEAKQQPVAQTSKP